MFVQVEALLLSGVIAYLLSGIPFAALYTRWGTGQDVSKIGSGNIGATNAFRSGKKTVGFATAISDVAKAVLAILIAGAIWYVVFEEKMPLLAVSAIAFVVTLGHMYSPYKRFKGGKGISVATGCLLVIDWRLAIGLALCWFIGALFSDMISFASVAGALVMPVLFFLRTGDLPASMIMTCVSALIIWKHRGNIRRIHDGSESRFGLFATIGMWLLRKTWLSKAEVWGLENLPQGGPYLLVANHLRNSDPFLIGSLTRTLVVFIAKKELWEQGFLKAAMMFWTEAIKIDRDNPGRVPMDRAVTALSKGRVVGVFPEEHRNKTPELGLLDLKPGAAFIAATAGVDVVPVSIVYPYSDKRKRVPRVVFGDIIKNPDNLKSEDKQIVLERYGAKKTRQALHALIVEALTRLCIENGAIPKPE